MDLAQLLALGLRVIQLALEAGEDVAVVIAIAKKMQAVAASGSQPTKAQFDELDAMVQPYLDTLNDTSRDDKSNAGQGAI